MKTLYKSLFYDWVEITEEQKENLIKYLNKGITAMADEEKQKYINSKFKQVN